MANKNDYITVEGRRYHFTEIDALLENTRHTHYSFIRDLHTFLVEWFDESDKIKVQTSGSTGTPKQMLVKKDRMTASAQMTCSFLDLKPNDTALLCMPLEYIAGKMMVVRAIVAELNLIVRTPSGHPLSDVDIHLSFAAMIPLQVYNSLQSEEHKKKLEGIDKLIIGGGAIDVVLENEIKTLPNASYSTYGMTETLSHIALRRLNGEDASLFYRPFSSIKLSLSENDTLVINAPHITDETITTNDIAEILPDGCFIIKGRRDNVINSGGVKIQIEEVESSLRPFIKGKFAITSKVDTKLGETVVLLLEEENDETCLQHHINAVLPRFHRPQYIIMTAKIPETLNGKTDRPACKRLV